jgi:hypothetical protein
MTEQVFDRELLDSLARQTGFVQRATSRLEGNDFVKLMSIEAFGQMPVISLVGLCDIVRQMNPEADMTPQALSQRINNQHAVEYMKEVFHFALQKHLELARQSIPTDLLNPFAYVLLEDSTQATLHEKLADHFKGSGGSTSKAALKIHYVYEFKRDAIREISISDGSVPDQSRTETIVEQLQPTDLVIRDLGYFSIRSLVRIATKMAFFLSRVLKSTTIYLSNEVRLPATDVIGYIDKNHPHQDVIDLDIYLGEEKLPCRLIAYRAPESVVNERLRKAKDTETGLGSPSLSRM